MAVESSNLFWYFYRRKRTTPWPLRYSLGVPSQSMLRKMKEEIRWAQVNITVQKIEGQLRCSEKRLSWRSLSSYGTWLGPLTSRVARCWTLSSWFISARSVGALAPTAYSRCGRTMAQYSGTNAVLENSQKDLRTIKSNRIRIIAAAH